MPSRLLTSGYLLVALASAAAAQQCGVCKSYGVDIKDGGSYFQNIESTIDFNATQEFTGCADDVAQNSLIDPNGNEYDCSDTPLQPADTPELLSCQISKDQMSSGAWSLIILSNNGNCSPIAYQRNFDLTVGLQSTVDLAATLTVSNVVTPIISKFMTATTTVTSTGPATTTTEGLLNFNPIFTLLPLPQIQVVTKAILTVTQTSHIPNVVATSTAFTQPSCNVPARRDVADPMAKILPKNLGSFAQKIFSELGINFKRDEIVGRSASTEYTRAILEGRAVGPELRARFVAERAAEMAERRKRAPDPETVTIEGTSTSTVTVSKTVAPTTVTGTTTLVDTTTITPTVTVQKCWFCFWQNVQTQTQKQMTITNTFWIPVTTVSSTDHPAVTLAVTGKTTPPVVEASCSSAGGVLL